MLFLVIIIRKSYRSWCLKWFVFVVCFLGYEGCCLVFLEINFDEIGWIGIIVFKKLNYVYCKGLCNGRCLFC